MSNACRPLIAAEADVFIRTPEDIRDALSASVGTDGLILTETDLSPDFFDLKTGLAGELLQKFANYRVRVAFIIPDPAAHGERFGELVHEHSAHRLVRFVRSREEADAWLNA
jgi:Domain of unknown function (DUF4180)